MWPTLRNTALSSVSRDSNKFLGGEIVYPLTPASSVAPIVGVKNVKSESYLKAWKFRPVILQTHRVGLELFLEYLQTSL